MIVVLVKHFSTKAFRRLHNSVGKTNIDKYVHKTEKVVR